MIYILICFDQRRGSTPLQKRDIIEVEPDKSKPDGLTSWPLPAPHITSDVMGKTSNMYLSSSKEIVYMLT